MFLSRGRRVARRRLAAQALLRDTAAGGGRLRDRGPGHDPLACMAVDLGLALFTQAALDNAARDASRLIMTGQVQMAGGSPTPFTAQLCADVSSSFPAAACNTTLRPEQLRRAHDSKVDGNGTLLDPQFVPGAAGQDVMVQVAYYRTPIIPVARARCSAATAACCCCRPSPSRTSPFHDPAARFGATSVAACWSNWPWWSRSWLRSARRLRAHPARPGRHEAAPGSADAGQPGRGPGFGDRRCARRFLHRRPPGDGAVCATGALRRDRRGHQFQQTQVVAIDWQNTSCGDAAPSPTPRRSPRSLVANPGDSVVMVRATFVYTTFSSYVLPAESP